MLECTCCNRSFSASVSLKNHLRWQDKDYRQKHTVTEEHKKQIKEDVDSVFLEILKHLEFDNN